MLLSLIRPSVEVKIARPHRTLAGALSGGFRLLFLPGAATASFSVDNAVASSFAAFARVGKDSAFFSARRRCGVLSFAVSNSANSSSRSILAVVTSRL